MWYHQQCFFKIRQPASFAAFDGFANLRYAHQVAMKKNLGQFSIQFEIAFCKTNNVLTLLSLQYFSSFNKGIDDIEIELEATANTSTKSDSRISIQYEEYFNIYDYIFRNVTYADRFEILNGDGQDRWYQPASATQVSVNTTH